MAAEESYPDELLYHREHDWVRLDGSEATFGVTWYAQDALGDLVVFNPPEVGAAIAADSEYGELESVKAVSGVDRAARGRGARGQRRGRRRTRGRQRRSVRQGLARARQAHRSVRGVRPAERGGLSRVPVDTLMGRPKLHRARARGAVQPAPHRPLAGRAGAHARASSDTTRSTRSHRRPCPRRSGCSTRSTCRRRRPRSTCSRSCATSGGATA